METSDIISVCALGISITSMLISLYRINLDRAKLSFNFTISFPNLIYFIKPHADNEPSYNYSPNNYIAGIKIEIVNPSLSPITIGDFSIIYNNVEYPLDVYHSYRFYNAGFERGDFLNHRNGKLLLPIKLEANGLISEYLCFPFRLFHQKENIKIILICKTAKKIYRKKLFLKLYESSEIEIGGTFL